LIFKFLFFSFFFNLFLLSSCFRSFSIFFFCLHFYIIFSLVKI
jgi:hypothetical protein